MFPAVRPSQVLQQHQLCHQTDIKEGITLSNQRKYILHTNKCEVCIKQFKLRIKADNFKIKLYKRFLKQKVI